jgi:phosphate transport system substrate-binding protein
MRKALLCCLVLVGLVVMACSPDLSVAPTTAPTPTVVAQPATPAVTGKVSVAGSTAVQPLAEKLAEGFMAKNRNVTIEVKGGGTGVGIKSGGTGAVDIGTASRAISDAEKKEYPDMKVFPIAHVGLAVVAHPGVTVRNLTRAQVQGIFAGEITNWEQVGGPNKTIIVASREEGSGTRGAFQELVMGKDKKIYDRAILQPSNGAIRTTVATTPDSISYLSFGYLDKSVKALAFEGVEPTVENVLAGKYPVVQPLSMVTKGDPTGAAKAWLDWILSPEGQTIVAKEDYIPVRK